MTESVETLLKHGANADIQARITTSSRSYKYETPMDLAVSRNVEEKRTDFVIHFHYIVGHRGIVTKFDHPMAKQLKYLMSARGIFSP